MKTIRIFLFLFVFVSGCDPFSSLNVTDKLGSFRIETDQETYVPDESVEVTFKNNLGVPVYFDGCGTNLQKNENGEWITVNGIICVFITRESIEIESGSKYERSISLLHDDNEDGLYRLVFNIGFESGEQLPEEFRTKELIVHKDGPL